MTLAESAARGALAMFWFQAASVPSDGARGESDAGGAGKTVHEPRSPDGAAARSPPKNVDARRRRGAARRSRRDAERRTVDATGAFAVSRG